ncbi:MAG: glycosyltransferase [Actinomycetota bacterium]
MSKNGQLIIEATQPLPDLDLARAEEWRVLLTFQGVPCAYFRVPSPGAVLDPALSEAAFLRHADGIATYSHFVERLQRRLGYVEPRYKRPTVSVVVCTHRRPTYILELLAALQCLDPAPDEILIVDNDPGDLDCRKEVEAAGARYLREDRRGLDNARNEGLRNATCELVAFTDDDCVPSTGWLRKLPELFDDPTVATVTGPGFAYALDTPSQVRFEETGGFSRGLKRRAWDWASLPPAASTRAGAGANMIYRRDVLMSLGEVFPPELDAGTPTQSGGDMYAMYKVLAAGHRIVYDPGTYVFHQHRPDPGSLHKTFWGYGVGLSATLTKLLVQEREMGVGHGWRWLWDQYYWTLRRWFAGNADETTIRIAWDHVRGGLHGPGAWLRASRALGASAPWQSPAQPPEEHGSEPHSESASAPSEPIVSVVIPTAGRRTALKRCLNALARQESLEEAFEVVVVDDSPSEAPRLSWDVAESLVVRTIQTGGLGAAAARNAGARVARGRFLLFLDDDLVPDQGLLAHHVTEHISHGRERAVIGYSPPRPVTKSLAAQRASLWWEDHFRAKERAIVMTFTHVLSGNVSLGRETFERLGGYDPEIGRFRREDWEFGLRLLRAEVDVVYQSRAVAHHEFSLDTREWIRAARSEGCGDALLLERFPYAAASLPRLGNDSRGPLKSLRHHAAMSVLGAEGTAGFVARLLDLLEHFKARSWWLRLFGLARRAAYVGGRRQGGEVGARGSSAVVTIELDSDEPIPAPRGVAPIVELMWQGRRAGRFELAEGHWDGTLADQASAALDSEVWPQLGAESIQRYEENTAIPDLSDVCIVFGPSHRWGDDRYRAEFEAAGATVHIAEGRAEQHWSAVAEAMESSEAAIVATTLPGVRPAPEWIAAARIGFAGDRVAAVVGVGLPLGQRAGPLILASRRTAPVPYTLFGSPTQFLVMRKDLLRGIGGLDASTAALGPHGPVLDVLERALEADYVCGYRETPGLLPEGSRREALPPAVAQRRHARAGLLARRAVAIGGLGGAAWFAARGCIPVAVGVAKGVRRGQDMRQSLRAVASFASGTFRALLDEDVRDGEVTGRPGSRRGAGAGPGPYAPTEELQAHAISAIPLEGPHGPAGAPQVPPAPADPGIGGPGF